MHVVRKLVTLGTALCIALSATPAIAEDTHPREYSVLYHGNFSDKDAHRFSYNLYYFGAVRSWTGATQYSTAGGERDVNHWDYTNGYSGVDPYAGANRRDLLYTSGHGYAGGLKLFEPSFHADPTREKDQYGRADNIGPDAGRYVDMEKVNWEIGSDWTGTNRTISRWDDDLEWIFLAACDQLTYTNDSRMLYARTLLGDPNRAHAIWGYDGAAPGDGPDIEIVDDFFYYAGRGTSNRYAWLKANSNHSSTNAAGIVHAAMQYEGLPPVSPLQSDSRVGSTPDIHYWYIPVWWYAQQPVADAGSLLDSLKDSVAGLFSVKSAHAGTPKTVVGVKTTYEVDVDLPELEALPVLRTGSTPEVGGQRTRSMLGGRTRAGWTVPDAEYDVEEGPRGAVRTWASGAHEALLKGEARGPVKMSREEAIEEAREYVEANGGMPDDAELVEVRGIACAPLDAEDGTTGPESVSEYTVRFGRNHGGVPVDGISGDAIEVSLDADGVREYRRGWREIKGKQSGNGTQASVPAQDALDVLAEQGESHLSLPSEVSVTDMELVYYSMGPRHAQSAMFPAWKITLDDSMHFYVNAVTGRAMNE